MPALTPEQTDSFLIDDNTGNVMVDSVGNIIITP